MTSELVAGFIEKWRDVDFAWLSAKSEAEIEYWNRVVFPARQIACKVLELKTLAERAHGTIYLQRFLDKRQPINATRQARRYLTGDNSVGLLCLQTAQTTSVYVIPHWRFLLVLALAAQRTMALRDPWCGGDFGPLFDKARAGVAPAIDVLLRNVAQIKVNTDEHVLDRVLNRAAAQRPTWSWPAHLHAWREFGSRSANLHTAVACWCAAQRALAAHAMLGTDSLGVLMYELGRLQALQPAADSTPVSSRLADYASPALRAAVEESDYEHDMLMHGALMPLYGAIDFMPRTELWCGSVRYTDRLFASQASGASARERHFAAELLVASVVDQVPGLSAWHRHLAARMQQSVAIQIATTGHAREPLALLTAMRFALPLRLDGVDYIIAAPLTAYVHGGRSAPLQNAHVVLPREQIVTLQIAAQSLVCAQRGRMSTANLMEAPNCERPLASPVLAHTLATSDDIEALCHALNGLGALVGLASDEWHADSRFARESARTTARLCARAAQLLISDQDSVVRATLGRSWMYQQQTERLAPDTGGGADEGGAGRKSAERGQIRHEDWGGLYSLLQVILLARRLPLVVPRSSMFELVSLGIVDGAKYASQLSNMARAPDESYEQWVERDAATSRSWSQMRSLDTQWYDELLTSTYRRRERAAPVDAAGLEQELRCNAQIKGAVDYYVVCACGVSSAECHTLLDNALHRKSPFVECCVCNTDLVPIPDVCVPSNSYMQGVCTHCADRVPWRTRTSDLAIDMPGAWFVVSQEQALDLIECLVEAIVTHPVHADLCLGVLQRLRQRVRLWLTNAGALGRAPARTAVSLQKQTSATTKMLFDYMAQRPADCADQRALLGRLLQQLRNATDLRSQVLGATLALSAQAAPANIDCSASHALGLYMAASELLVTWSPTVLFSICKAIDTEPQSCEKLVGALADYFCPLRDQAGFAAYVAAQLNDTCFPLIDSPLVGTTVAAYDNYSKQARHLPQRVERLLDHTGQPRLLTGTTPWMLETIMLNWYADH